jgi:hypothetical protein
MAKVFSPTKFHNYKFSKRACNTIYARFLSFTVPLLSDFFYAAKLEKFSAGNKTEIKLTRRAFDPRSTSLLAFSPRNLWLRVMNYEYESRFLFIIA